MTKEDLKSKFEDSFDAHSHASEGGMGPDVTDWRGMWRSFEPAILEYAKQQAIAFDIWKIKNHWLWDGSTCRYFKCEEKHQATYLTHEEIYSQFIEQQNKEQ